MTDRAPDIGERVRKVILRALELADEPTDESRVEDLADSLEAVDILCKLEEEFGVQLTDEEFFDAQTVGDVIKVVGEKVGQLPVA